MKHVRFVALVVLILAAALAIASDDKTQAIKGEIVDTHCYLAKGAHGEEHKGCSNACLSRDVPAGLLSDDGTLYLLLAEKPVSVKEMVAGKAGQKVTAHGKVVEKNGMKAIQLASID